MVEEAAATSLGPSTTVDSSILLEALHAEGSKGDSGLGLSWPPPVSSSSTLSFVASENLTTATLSTTPPLPHPFALRACVERAAKRRWQQLLKSPASLPPPAPIIEISKVPHELLVRAFEAFQGYVRRETLSLLPDNFLDVNVWQDDPCVLHAKFEDMLRPHIVDRLYRSKT